MKRALWLVPFLSLFSCAHQGSFGNFSSRAQKNSEALHTGSRVCRPLGDTERNLVLSIANPENFPATRYRRGPSSLRGIEKETDCSHFVHEVYRRAGLNYEFRTTGELGNAREFDILPEKDAKPGDLMLFRGHVGIVDAKGRIISALRTRHRRRKSSITAIDRGNFHSFRGQRYVLRYRCQPATVATAASEKRKK